MIKIKNAATGDVVKVHHTTITAAGEIITEKGTTRFFNSYAMFKAVERRADGVVIELIDPSAWELEKMRKRRTRAEMESAGGAQPTTPAEPATPATPAEPATPATPAEPAQPAQPATFQTGGVTDALTAAFAPVFANVAANIRAEILAQVENEFKELRAAANSRARRLEVVTPDGNAHRVEGVVCEEFDEIVQDVAAGYNVYMWGAAGCGKSHTAEQVAQALGLDFYCQTTVQFAHDVRGYGDAAGRFIETPFYKAFANGGLYHQDEIDRSMPEALIVENTALANGYYDFPVVGRVKAHKNFRFMASGNTVGAGADEQYTAGQALDASSRDRLVYYEMHYDRRVELPIMAQGDEILCDFVEDVRQAIKETGVNHIVSYRATKYMKEHENNKEKALIRSTFKGLAVDEMRIIYGALKDFENPWAKALYKVTKAH